jgi:hypothetical protein
MPQGKRRIAPLRRAEVAFADLINGNPDGFMVRWLGPDMQQPWVVCLPDYPGDAVGLLQSRTGRGDTLHEAVIQVRAKVR